MNDHEVLYLHHTKVRSQSTEIRILLEKQIALKERIAKLEAELANRQPAVMVAIHKPIATVTVDAAGILWDAVDTEVARSLPYGTHDLYTVADRTAANGAGAL